MDPILNDNPTNQTMSLEEIQNLVLSFQDQIAGLDYRITNKNFGSKIYQTKETIASRGRFVAGAKEDVVIMDGQNPTWRLWAGASAPGSAPFRVDKDGNVTATSITLSGYVAVGGSAADVNGNATTISGGKITASSIAADRLSVSQLSAISADLGSITAGTITGALIRTSSSGHRVIIDGSTDNIEFYNASNDNTILLDGAQTDSAESQIRVGGGIFLAGSVSATYAYGTQIWSGGFGGTGIATFIDAIGDGSTGTFSVRSDGELWHYGSGGGSPVLIISDTGDLTIPLGAITLTAGQMYFDDGSLNMSAGFVNLARMTGTVADARSDYRNGSMYYRTSDNVIRVYLNGAWKTITTS